MTGDLTQGAKAIIFPLYFPNDYTVLVAPSRTSVASNSLGVRRNNIHEKIDVYGNSTSQTAGGFYLAFGW